MKSRASSAFSGCHLIASLVAALATAAPCVAQTYLVQEITKPAGVNIFLLPSVMNSSGQVVVNTMFKDGRFDAPGASYFWDNGQIISLASVPGYSGSRVIGIADNGRIIGHTASPYQVNPPQYALFWEPVRNQAGQITGYSAPRKWDDTVQSTGWRFEIATEISANGQFVVFTQVSDSGAHRQVLADVLNPTEMRIWPLFESGGVIQAVHYDGGLVRVSGTYGSRACIWTLDPSDPLSGPTLDYLPDTAVNARSNAYSVNAGDAVGYATVTGTNTSTTKSYLWRNGAAILLGTLSGTTATPSWINRDGWIVGSCSITSKTVPSHGVIWRSPTVIADLNNLKHSSDRSGYEITHAHSITDSGLIVGYGVKNKVGSPILLRPAAP